MPKQDEESPIDGMDNPIDHVNALIHTLYKLPLGGPPFHREHSRRVADFSTSVFDQWAGRKGISRSERNDLRKRIAQAGFLHDIGMRDRSPLLHGNAEDTSGDLRMMILNHPIAGARFARASFNIPALTSAILHHHEKWDGSGYPGNIGPDLKAIREDRVTGIADNDIPFIARVLSVAETYCTMRMASPWRLAVEKYEALDRMKDLAGKSLDPDLMTDFFRAMEEYEWLDDGSEWDCAES